jgi:hypothetical protein
VARLATEGAEVSKSWLEPYEILTANKPRNPLTRSPEQAVSAPAEVECTDDNFPVAQNPCAEIQRAAVPAPAWRRLLKRTLLTVRVTPLLALIVGTAVCLVAALSFWRGYRAGSADGQLPQQVRPGSFDEIRRSRVVLFDDLEVDQGRFRR